MAGQRFTSGQVSTWGATPRELTTASTTVGFDTFGLAGWILVTTITTWSHSTNVTYYYPALFEGNWSLSNIRIEVTTAGSASSTAVVGIYNADYLFQPTTLVAQTSTFAIDSTGVKTVNITASGSGGRYLFAVNQSANVTYRVKYGYPPIGPVSNSGSDGWQVARRVSETYSATMPASGTAWTTVSTNASDFTPIWPKVGI
jgi:hypothetical protein